MAGWHSKQSLAAVSVGTNIFQPLTIFVFGLLYAITPIAAQYKGSRDRHKLTSLVIGSTIASIVLSIPFLFFFQHMGYVTELFSVNPHIEMGVTGYLSAIGYGLPFMFIYLSLRFFHDGIFLSKSVFLASLIIFPINILLNWTFLYGINGSVKFGVAGLGISTSLCWLILSIILFTSIVNHQYVSISAFKYVRSWVKEIRKIFVLGTPIGFSIGIELIMLGLIGLAIAKYTVASVAGYQIIISMAYVFLRIPLGISSAVAARSGYYYAQSEYTILSDLRRVIFTFGLLITSIITLTFILIGNSIASLYTRDPAVLGVVSNLLIFGAFMQIPAGLVYILNGFYRGINRSNSVPPIYLICFIFFCYLISYLLNDVFKLEVTGYFITLVSSYGLCALVMWKCLLIQFRRMNSRNIHPFNKLEANG